MITDYNWVNCVFRDSVYWTSELLTRKRSILDEDWWTEEQYGYCIKDGFLILQLSLSP